MSGDFGWVQAGLTRLGLGESRGRRRHRHLSWARLTLVVVVVAALIPALSNPASALTATTTTVTSSANPAVAGVSVNLTATVVATTTPTGQVQFMDGPNALGSSVFLATVNGTTARAVLPISTLAGGTHQITAVYSPSGVFGPSTSSAVNQIITLKPTSTTLITSLNPAPAVSQPTLTATVSPAPSVAGGSVTFYDGQNPLGTSALSAGGVATLVPSSPTLTIGVHALFAQYQGDATDAPSAGSLSQTISANGVTMQVTITPSSTPDTTQTPTVTVLVQDPGAPGVRIPTGNVYAIDDSTTGQIGQATLDGSGTGVINLGVPFAAGTHVLRIYYSGDNQYTPADSSQNVVVSSPALPAALTSSVTSPAAGTPVTLTGTFTVPGGDPPPTGAVYFTDAGGTMTTASFDGVTGTVTAPWTFTTVGVHPVAMTFLGDSVYAPSTVLKTITVTQRSQPMTFTSGTNPTTTSGAPTLLTVSLTGPSSPLPTGFVTFYVDNTDVGAASVQSNKKATLTINPTTGKHAVTAVYSGDANYGSGSTATLIQTVVSGSDTRPASTVALTTSQASPVTPGVPLTVTATVTGTGTPTGSVILASPFGSGQDQTATLNASGVATFTIVPANDGSFALTASYSGDGANLPSAASIAPSVTHLTTTTTLTTSPLLANQPITLTATVTSTGGTPTGTVQFGNPYTQSFGTAPLDGNGIATMVLNNLPNGPTPLIASYLGDNTFANSSSTPTTSTVALASDSIVLGVTNSGLNYTVSATVTGQPNMPTPTGYVYFGLNSTGDFSAAVALDGTGHASYTFTYPAVLNGPALFHAVYLGGDIYYNTQGVYATVGTSSLQTVGLPAPAVTVSASANPARTDKPVNLTAVVATTPGQPIPTGNVTFYTQSINSTPGLILTGTLDATGKAQVTAPGTGNIAPGVYAVMATYNPNGNSWYSTSGGTLNLTADLATSTALTVSPNPVTAGSSTTLTATVTAATTSGTPPVVAGNVNFFSGTTLLGTSALNGSGVATLATSAIPRGTQSVTAVYVGNAAFAQSTSSAVSVTVNALTPTTTLTSSANPGQTGTPITFSATVHGTGPVPTGTVTFSVASTVLATVALDGIGAASTPDTFSAAATPTISATYSGDGVYLPATLTSFVQTVNWATSTVVSGAPNPSAALQSVTFTATVTSAGGTPTGNVTFKDGATTLGTGALNGSGVATFATSALLVGSHPITAVYAGAGSFAGSTSASSAQVVNLATSSTALGSSGTPSLTNHSVTFTATVTGGTATPTGTVNFFDGTTLLGSGALSSGVATFATSALAAGSHSITATYSGDTTYATSTSSVFSQVVNKNGSSIALVSGTNPSLSGQFVTFTATASGTFGTPTGTITFFDGATALSTVGVNASGVATFAIGSLSAGSHNITATYNGDGIYLPQTSTVLAQTVKLASATALATSASPAVLATSVTFTATITGSGATPTGTVTFFDGATSLGSSALNGSGVATLAVTTLTAGSHAITATYNGDTNYAASTSGVVTQSIIRTSGTAVVSSANPSALGQSVNFTATVTGAGATPTGTVVFKDGATTLATIGLNGSGVATYATSALSVASHSITAVYSGDGNYATSTSSVLTQVVTTTASATALTSSPNPSALAQSVTLTATVTGTQGTPTGTVTFFDGATSIGSSALNGSGVATMSTTSLASGSHSLTATYGGNGTYATSTSTAVNQSVLAASTSVLTTSANPSPVGQPLTLTAAVTSSAGTPTGTASFVDGSTTLASVPLDGTGHASFVTSALTAGSHALTVVYGGSATISGGTSAVVTEIVGAAGYHPLTPARDIDTRNGTGITQGRLTGGTNTSFVVTGVNGVPSTGVGSVALTFTVIGPNCSGDINVWPTGSAKPTVSNANFTNSQTISALVVATVGVNGQVSVAMSCAGTFDLTVDVAGWYNATGGVGGGIYTALAPARDLDTRFGTGAPLAPVLSTTPVNLTVLGVNGVPASGVSAVVLNVTVTNPICGGNVTVWPTGATKPTTSNINYGTSTTLANLVLATVGTGGQVSLSISACSSSTGSADLIADVAGYYSSGTVGSSGYVGLTPGRDLDTRFGQGAPIAPVASGTPLSFTVDGVNGVPASGVSAVVLNLTVTNPSCAGTLTAYAAGTATPLATAVSFAPGDTIPTLAIVPVGAGGQVSLALTCNSGSGTTDVIADVAGYYLS
jgi:hypothetical protein